MSSAAGLLENCSKSHSISLLPNTTAIPRNRSSLRTHTLRPFHKTFIHISFPFCFGGFVSLFLVFIYFLYYFLLDQNSFFEKSFFCLIWPSNLIWYNFSFEMFDFQVMCKQIKMKLKILFKLVSSDIYMRKFVFYTYYALDFK